MKVGFVIKVEEQVYCLLITFTVNKLRLVIIYFNLRLYKFFKVVRRYDQRSKLCKNLEAQFIG